MIEEVIVRTLVEYINQIERFSPDFSLSRGQSQDLALLPSAFRLDSSGMRCYSNKDIKLFLDDFKTNSSIYIEDAVSYRENDWLIHAQHFGVPTCLLDFTYSPLVSLMFALENAFNYDCADERYSVVWLLNPIICNTKNINEDSIVNLTETDMSKLENYKKPFVAKARKNNSRIVVQNGLFVYFKSNSSALEKVENADAFLKKLLIPHSDARLMLRSLYVLGMRFSALYPELSSVSKDIILKNKVMESYKQEEGYE